MVEALTERLREDLGDEPPEEAGALTEHADPVLGRLWRNETDSVYDDLTIYSRGDVVLVKFVFADEKGVKQCPGLLVSSDQYHRSRREASLAAITSHVGRSLVGDCRLTQWQDAGLPLPSTVTGIIRTIRQDMIIRKLGALPPAELANVESQLRVSLALPGA